MQAWRPFLKRDIDNLEKVQHTASKMINECKLLSYNDRLVKTGLATLEDRRTRGDMIEVFKIINGIDNLDVKNFFSFSGSSRTRGHEHKLTKSRSRLDIRKHSFSQRVVNKWNELPEVVVDAKSVNCFKNRYESYDKLVREKNSV